MTSTKTRPDPEVLDPTPTLDYSGNHGMSTLHGVHRTRNAALRSALAGLPEYLTQLAALRELDRCEVPDAPPGTPETLLGDRLIETLLDGAPAPRPTDLVAQAVELASAGQNRYIVEAAIKRARTLMTLRLDALVTRNSDSMLSTLHRQMETAVAEARDLAVSGPLQRLLDADAVLDAGAGAIENARRLRDVLNTYSAVRSAQQQLTTAVGGGEQQMTGARPEWPELMILRDPLAVFPNFLPWHRRGCLVTRRGQHKEVRLDPPWPHLKRGAAPGMKGQRIKAFEQDALAPEFFIWAVEDQVDLWVPTSAQLDAAQTTMREAESARVDDGKSELMDPDPPRPARPTTASRLHPTIAGGLEPWPPAVIY